MMNRRPRWLIPPEEVCVFSNLHAYLFCLACLLSFCSGCSSGWWWWLLWRGFHAILKCKCDFRMGGGTITMMFCYLELHAVTVPCGNPVHRSQFFMVWPWKHTFGEKQNRFCFAFCLTTNQESSVKRLHYTQFSDEIMPHHIQMWRAFSFFSKSAIRSL